MTNRQSPDSLSNFSFKNTSSADELSDTDETLQSREIFATSRVRRIEHQGEYYYLRLTRSGKLILSK